MNDGFLPKAAAHAFAAALLFAAVAGVSRAAGRPVRGWLPMTVLLLLCFAATSVRVLGLTAAGWLRGFLPGVSLPTGILVAHACLRLCGRHGLLHGRDFFGLWGFGAAAGLILYPAAMGWGSWDPYAAGWSRSWVVITAGILCIVALFRGHRLGMVLLATVLAWRIGLLESRNYWDYLVDPLFAATALILFAASSFRWSGRQSWGWRTNKTKCQVT